MRKSFLVRQVLTTRRRTVRATSVVMLGIVMVSFALITSAAQAGVSDSLIAYWNFNDEPSGAIPASLQANVGSGEIDLSGWEGGADIGSGFSGSGTELNALFGDPAGNSFRLWGGTDGSPGNFTHIDFQFSMADRQNLSISFALRPQWSPASGDHTFDTHIWSWSTDGVNFNDALGYELTEFGGISNWELRDLDFSSVTGLNGAEEVTLRLTLSGANSAQRTSFDNIQLHAAAIPAPGALALLGLAGLSVGRTRRRESR